MAEPVDNDETRASSPPPVRGSQLVRRDASWHYELITRPRLPRAIGAMAASGLDVVAGRVPKPIDPLGDDPPLPARWPSDVDDAPACKPAVVGVCGGRGAIPTAPIDEVRTAAILATTTFELTKADAGLEMIEIRARYEDGIAMWLDGVEVARQALPKDRVVSLATRPHGPEWETFYVPVAPGLLRLGTNTLAIEVHPHGRRVAPLVELDMIGRKDAGIVRGPLIADVGETTATIVVETDPGVDAMIEWGSGSFEHQQASPPGRRHSFQLAQLPAHGTVQYRVHAGATQSATYHLRTQPAAGDTIRIGVYGDVRGGHAVHRKLVEAMRGEAFDLVAVTGDMVLHGFDEADWQRFFAITAELVAEIPYLPAIGNHDLGWEGVSTTKRRAEDVFAMPPPPPGRPADVYWYSYDLADIHLVFLDSNAYERAEQETWLDQDLAAARKRNVRAILAFTHEPPYSRGVHRGNTLARTRYVPILTRYRTNLLVAGHDHLYERGEIDNLRYIVSGGGGAPLYPVTCGIAGRPACKVSDGMKTMVKEHHYLALSIGKDVVEMCPRRGDGTLLENCVRYRLSR